MVAFSSACPRVGISSVEIVTERCGSFRFHPRPRRLAAEAVLFYALCHDGVPGAAPEELLFDLRWKRSGHLASLTLLDPTNAPSHAVGSATFWMATAQFVIYYLTLRWVEAPDVLTALPNLPLPGRLGALLTRGIVPGPGGLNHKRHLIRLHRAVQRSQRAIPPPCESLSFPTDAALHETGLDESFAMVRFSKVKDDDS